ncbi:hypothetical protein SRB5_25870 [Streptomyces sp. RB5]|uniref:Uncharacterized protein n=1 Tax=Streptomyces smaragdinus TaxID=2585196 RepID=A0A7K0CGE2_9ACTN|nr:hypothetical protein [Streptomyces smaragdinus]MQY12453.1 hypothetical protein [Streptomyces smaragdinus]
MTPTSEWQLALDAVDTAFAQPPAFDRPMSGCTRCLTESDLLLLGGDVSGVSDDLLGYFVRKVPDHWDDDQYPVLWRRLFPRAVRMWGPGLETDPSLAMSHLHGAGLASWPDPERDAVDQAFRALLSLALTDGRRPTAVFDMLEGIAAATDGIAPWLSHLAAVPGREADAGLARVALSWGAEVLWEDLQFTWYYSGRIDEVADWLPTLRPRLTSFAAMHPRCKTAVDALAALSALERGERAPWFYPGASNVLPLITAGSASPRPWAP